MNDAEVFEGEHQGRTIFCSGFPADIQYREIRNLFRFLSGYQYCVLNLKGKVPTAFAHFDDDNTAHTAIDRLHGILYDEENYPTYKIRAEMAKSNIRKPNTTTTSRRKRFGDPPQNNGAKRYGKSLPFRNGPSSFNARPGPFPIPATPTYPVAGEDRFQPRPLPFQRTPFSPSFGSRLTEPPYSVGHAKSPYRTPPTSYYRNEPSKMHFEKYAPNESSNSDITTLFVCNLGMYATEEEIRQLFIQQPGFRRIKFNNSHESKPPVAFVNFTSNSAALRSLHAFQGVTLKSSERGGLKIEFAKKNMGAPRDRGDFGDLGDLGERENQGTHQGYEETLAEIIPSLEPIR